MDVAARILTAHGVEQVQITEVAEQAGVSRPLVYRLFPTRQQLVEALLQDFATRLGERFHAALLASLPGSLEEMTRALSKPAVPQSSRGAGPWLLLDARADAELGRIGHTILADLLKPWQHRLAELTGLPPRRTQNVLWTVVAAGRAALDGWIMGRISRRDAIADATRAVSVLLQAFARPAALDSRGYCKLFAFGDGRRALTLLQIACINDCSWPCWFHPLCARDSSACCLCCA